MSRKPAKAAPKPFLAWAVASPMGYMAASGIGRTQKAAIEAFLTFFADPSVRRREWVRMRRGWRCVRVTVLPIDAAASAPGGAV